MATFYAGRADGAALPVAFVWNPFKLPCAQWRVATALRCYARAFIQVGLLLFSPHRTALRPCRVVLLLASGLRHT